MSNILCVLRRSVEVKDEESKQLATSLFKSPPHAKLALSCASPSMCEHAGCECVCVGILNPRLCNFFRESLVERLQRILSHTQSLQ